VSEREGDRIDRSDGATSLDAFACAGLAVIPIERRSVSVAAWDVLIQSRSDEVELGIWVSGQNRCGRVQMAPAEARRIAALLNKAADLAEAAGGVSDPGVGA
jgi:hypothetical protein